MQLIPVTRGEREADLAGLAAIEAERRFLDAKYQQQLARLARTSCAEDLTPANIDKHYVREDVACLLRITPDTARGWLADAVDAADHYPELNKTLEAGETTLAHCSAFTRVAIGLTPEQKRRLLDLVIDKARTQTLVEFRQSLAKALLKVRPAEEEQARQDRDASRHMCVRHAMTGTSTLYMELPTEAAVLSAANVEALALEWSRVPGETRTLEQLRVDAATHLLQGGDGAARTIGVNLCVSLSTLSGDDQEPAELDVPLPRSLGGGIVATTPEQARLIATAAEKFRRLVTDPLGQLIDFGRTVYRPPADLARLVRARDRTCTFVHCTRPALRCDLDHRHPWECGGETCELNIDCLCERHHYLKQNTTWRTIVLPDGSRQWASPGGRIYTRPPAVYPVDQTRSGTTDPLFRDRPAPEDHREPQAPDAPPPF